MRQVGELIDALPFSMPGTALSCHFCAGALTLHSRLSSGHTGAAPLMCMAPQCAPCLKFKSRWCFGLSFCSETSSFTPHDNRPLLPQSML